MIKVKNLHKSFDGTEVLKGINTSFEPGQTSLIIGQSGSGKTVFLKCLLGLHKPTKGDIYFNDKTYNDFTKTKKSLLRKNMGMVFQGGALFDSMTVYENVMFPLRMFTKMTKAEMDNRVTEVLDRVNLSNANDKFPSEISGGMQKRVSIARAIVNKPKFLFCDEPNSGLDPNTATIIDQLILEITKENNITTVVNTHDMNSVFEIGEKIVYLQGGIIEWEGNNKIIHNADNKDLISFVYSSNLFKKVRVAQQKGY
ncbi:ABC transporter ATP-binding protein [Psychroflexus halocasei]|uniref:Phospholipid/cholesterol/gamma-HCH transport system ATP-binding protein n=1 Tax=Psychroflexus halocasei TaxID=908615 RepID=A0A1H3VD21_9FLAO|nr:ATP-binding cassette domain-containing protein [Psychroflexus halocasei]SDZ72706.1 phospholipid/cholesterol/gamma-HCH transport system ATP-binding protein [Psychroflexus halocasei]